MKEQLLAQTPGKTNEIYFIEESSDRKHWHFRSIHVDQIDTFCETTELKFDRFTENGVPVLVKSQPAELMEPQTPESPGMSAFKSELADALKDFLIHAKSNDANY